MNYKEKATDIYEKMQQGKLLEAFDQYYADSVIMTEPRGTRKGKKSCRAYEEQFLESVKEFHGMDITNIGSDEENGVTFVESAMDLTFKEGGRVTMEQVAVQQWEGNQIVHERFYYDNSQ